MTNDKTTVTRGAVRGPCEGVRTEIDDDVHAHLERYVARLEAIDDDRDIRILYKH